MSLNDLADLSPEVYGDLLHEAISDLLEPQDDVSPADREGCGEGLL